SDLFGFVSRKYRVGGVTRITITRHETRQRPCRFFFLTSRPIYRNRCSEHIVILSRGRSYHDKKFSFSPTQICKCPIVSAVKSSAPHSYFLCHWLIFDLGWIK